MDWREQGRAAALNGVPLANKSAVEAECAGLGIPADMALYAAGWERGAAEYCAPLGVLKRATRREASLRICADPDGELAEIAAIGAEYRLATAALSGAEAVIARSRRDIDRRRDRVAKRLGQIDDLKAQLATAPEPALPEIRNAIAKYRGKIDRQRKRIREARRRRAEAEAALPALARDRDGTLASLEAVERLLARRAARTQTLSPYLQKPMPFNGLPPTWRG